MELTQEYFDQHYQELHEFLGGQFTRLEKKMDDGFAQVDERFAQVDAHFSQMTIRLDFIQKEIEEIKQELELVSRRTIEDADAAAKDILSLRRRVDELEKQVRLLSVQHSTQVA